MGIICEGFKVVFNSLEQWRKNQEEPVIENSNFLRLRVPKCPITALTEHIFLDFYEPFFYKALISKICSHQWESRFPSFGTLSNESNRTLPVPSKRMDTLMSERTVKKNCYLGIFSLSGSCGW